MTEFRRNIKGRGASSQPDNRFLRDSYRPEAQEWDGYLEEERPLLRTEFIRDASRTIITENKSPDVGFRFSVNAYRGCEHGCAYCYARPTHEYLGFSAGLDFESKIMVKEDAPELLREKLMSKSWEPAPVFMSGVTDCYQPAERKFQLTRRLLRVFADFKNPVGMITKNALIVRDLDILEELNAFGGTMAMLSVTTLDDRLGAALEPRTSRPMARLEAVRRLAEKGIPVGINIAPVIPGLNDHEIPKILEAAAQAGAKFAGMGMLRLPLTVLPVFTEWLEVHRPGEKEKVLSRIREVRGGRMNDADFGSRMRGEGPLAEHTTQMFRVYARKFRLEKWEVELSTEHFQRPGEQMKLF